MENSKLSQYEGDTVTLSSSLSGTFAFPEWRGPPSLKLYTNKGDPSGTINPEAPAASRLKYDSNNKDLILSNAVKADSGDYKCSYTGLGDHTITLEVNPAPVEASAEDEKQGNAEFKYVEKCYSVGQTLTLEAKYTGSGTPSVVQWSYSGGNGANLMIITSNCTVFGSIPAGYPSATRMNFTCSDSTYTLTVTGLTPDELTKSWGATFTPPLGLAPSAVQIPIPVCTDEKDGLSGGKNAGIVVGAVGGVGFVAGVAIFAYFKYKNET